MALLVEYYKRLPERRPDEDSSAWAVRLQEGLEAFRHEAAMRYAEGTLQRLLAEHHRDARRAAVLGLGMIGTLAASKPVAGRLHDRDSQVRQLAHDALWSIWFRADTPDHNQDLQKLLRFRNPQKALAGLDALIQRAPSFAEAYNQRAIVHFRMEEFQKSIGDCETVLKLNPYHFGAASGMAQCYMKLHKPKAALRAFRSAYRINPNLEGVEETIRTLEDVLGEEGKKEDR